MEDITGKRYGRLVAIRPDHKDKNGKYYWLFKCDCGNEKVICKNSVSNGLSKSCGCIFNEYVEKRKTIIGGMTKKELFEKYDCAKRLLNVYNKIISRCENPKDRTYKWYGAKGVSVCKEWRTDFMNFLNWAISVGYDNNKSRTEQTIDRINPFLGYNPDNCRLISLEMQLKNKRKSYKNNNL